MKRTQPLESHMYGDPAMVLERKQAAEANAAKRGEKRPTLHVRKEWSEARKAAESLFDFARGASVSSVQSPALSASESRPGDSTGKNTP